MVEKSKLSTIFTLHHVTSHDLLVVDNLAYGLMINSTMAPVTCVKLSITNVCLVKMTLYVMGLRCGVLYNISICNFNVRTYVK